MHLNDLEHERRCHSRYFPLRFFESLSQFRKGISGMIVWYPRHKLECQLTFLK